MMTERAFKVYAPPILRMAMAFLYFFLGIYQFISPEWFTKAVPLWATSFGLSATMIVHLIGTVELLLALPLLLGIFVKFSALALSILLLAVSFSTGINAGLIRDIGLATAVFIIFLDGDDIWSLEKKIFRKKLEAEGNPHFTEGTKGYDIIKILLKGYEMMGKDEFSECARLYGQIKELYSELSEKDKDAIKQDIVSFYDEILAAYSNFKQGISNSVSNKK